MLEQMLEELSQNIEAVINEQVDTRIQGLKDANIKMKADILQKEKIIKKQQEMLKAKDTEDLMIKLLDSLKKRLTNIDEKCVRDQMVLNFLDSLFEKDFDENGIDCSLWLLACTQYYSNREMVIQVLRYLDVYVPQGAELFRLPHEWTEDELDIVFSTMFKHIVCNQCIFDGNLRFWEQNALKDVSSVCHDRHYSEIPWQFLLRNPNLLKDKYLEKIGNMAFEDSHVSGWRYLFKLPKYQELTTQQLSKIIDNINPYASISSNRFEFVNVFLLENLEHIKSTALLDSLYDKFCDSYDFKYNRYILKMPYNYLKKWIVNQSSPLDWIERNKNEFSEDQRKELLTIVMEEYLK